jgi:hypothetical protein
MEYFMKRRELTTLMGLSLLLAVTGCGKSTGDDTGSTSTTDTSTTDTSTTDTGDTGDTTDMTDAGNDIANATPIELATEADWFAADAISPAGDRDFYSLDLVAGDMVQIAAGSYMFTEPDVVLDTVLRVYGPDEAMITENDDMPYRFYETDSAVFFQATEDGTYYVEVLEWGDWDASSGANGGSSYQYQLWGYLMSTSENEPNDFEDDATDLSIQDIDGDGLMDQYVGSAYTDSVTMFYGDMGEDGDQDLWPMTFDEDWGIGNYCQWSTWPGSTGPMEIEFTLYNEYMEPVAQTMDTDIEPTWSFIYDAGITYKVGEGTYYLGVVDAYEASGPGTFYPGLFTCYAETLSEVEEEDNDTTVTATLVSFTESETTPGYFYNRVSGDLSPGDAGDFIWVRSSDIGDLNGQFLNITVAAEAEGSMLDANLTVWGDMGDNNWQELEYVTDNANGLDPHIVDLELSASWVSIVIEINADDQSNIEGANSWHMMTDIFSEASSN